LRWGSRGKRSPNADPQTVEPGVGLFAEVVHLHDEGGITDPGTAADDARVRAILCPFPNVAIHVVEAELIGRK
jgi:hypothetical protein